MPCGVSGSGGESLRRRRVLCIILLYSAQYLYCTLLREVYDTVYTIQVIELWEIPWEGGEQGNH
jgi:hypothetical protein